ncbi:MAG: mechanosensitive ion channel domain-containing protein [Gemmatimonadota bacterium]
MLLLAVAAATGAAQERPDSAVAAARSESIPHAVDDDVESPRSPRASVAAFLQLTSAARYDAAAAYLTLAPDRAGDGAALARQLRAVLDRHLRLNLDRISGGALGDTTDGLAPGVERVGIIVGPAGDSASVRLVRDAVLIRDALGTPSGPEWRFGASTVARIPAWYDALEGRWALEYLPAPLLRVGPAAILWWQWIGLAVLLIVAYAIGKLAARLIRSSVGRLVSRTEATWDDAILERMTGPIGVAGALLLLSALLPMLGLAATPEARVYQLVRGAIFVDFFWALWRLVDVARDMLVTSSWAADTTSSRALIPLGARVAKVVVAAISVVATLSMLGYPVASLIAGLGLGGLAFALAAQKTVENLFGAFSLGVDQPFRETDFVKIEDFVGTVEAIGLRSTRFRTLDRTLVSIPNGRLAEMRIESFTARDRLRLATVIGLVYETSAAQVREVLSGFERVLRAHPKIWPDAVVVRFSAFAASSLDIEIMAWFQTSNWGEFQGIRQEILLDFMAVVEEVGSSFAFPTQTLHLVRDRQEVPSSPVDEPSTSEARGQQVHENHQ